VAGRRVVLGIRPEHVSLEIGDGLGGDAQVTLVEPMGSHLVVWLSLQGQQVSVTVPMNVDAVVGQRVKLHIDAARASLFDPDTQQRL
jgi:multiple sugar transport system ATP-binding protein